MTTDNATSYAIETIDPDATPEQLEAIIRLCTLRLMAFVDIAKAGLLDD